MHSDILNIFDCFDLMLHRLLFFLFFFFNDTATTEIYTLSLHDALPIYTESSAAAMPPSLTRESRTRDWGRPSRADTASSIRCSDPDRKSTRLNSSHSQISYAVFCLKKKKKKHTTIIMINNLLVSYA